MDALNKKYDIEISVLSPLSIGAGAEKDLVKGADFVIVDKQIYILDLRKLVKAGIDISAYSTLVSSKDMKGIIKLLGNKLAAVADRIIEMPASTDNDIKSFIKNQLSGNPIIPGSSLKGAIRSVLFTYLRDMEVKTPEVFGKIKDGGDFMRFIKISDAEFGGTNLFNTKIFNLRNENGHNWAGGWKHSAVKTDANFNPVGFNTIYEALTYGDSSNGSIMLNKKGFDAFSKSEYSKYDNKQPRKEKALDIHKLFEIINKHTEKYLRQEKHFFEKYHADRSDEIVEFIDVMIDNIKESDKDSCILKMSAGSGFHSITGDWQFEDFTNTGLHSSGKNAGKMKYKSRKVVVTDYGLELMGFVKLRIMSEEEILKIEEEKRIEAEKSKQRFEEKIRQKKLAEQELAEQKQKKETDARDYAEAVSLAENYFHNEEYEKALEMILKADSIYPGDIRHKEIRDAVENKIKNKKLAEDIANAEAEEAEKIKNANSVPLSEKLANSKNFGTAIGNAKTWMKRNELTTLSEEDLNVLKSKLKEIYDAAKPKDQKKMSSSNDWKKIADLLGDDIADKWRIEIVG